MPINASLGDLSNTLLLAAVVLYALAMLCYASDFAFARHRVMAGLTDTSVAEVPAAEFVTAGSGGPAAGGSGVSSPGDSAAAVAASTPPPSAAALGAAATRWPSGFWLRLAFALT